MLGVAIPCDGFLFPVRSRRQSCLSEIEDIHLETLPDTDAELLARMGAGDEAASRALMTRKLPRMHALALRMLGNTNDADDVTQEAFLRSWKQARRWQTGRALFDTWLHRVVLNLCYDRLRRRREIATAEPPEQVDPALPADHGMIQSETADRVRMAIHTLPERQRDAIILHVYQELSNIEIARTLDVSVEALESLLSRARRTLRARLEGIES